MKSGDTFQSVDIDLNDHLWIVISDPLIDDREIVIVNVTTWRAYHDQQCLLYVGDHPFVKHRSCVLFRRAKIVSLEKLESLLDRGLLKMNAPVNQSLLQQIRDGARACKLFPIGMRGILEDQDLI